MKRGKEKTRDQVKEGGDPNFIGWTGRCPPSGKTGRRTPTVYCNPPRVVEKQPLLNREEEGDESRHRHCDNENTAAWGSIPSICLFFLTGKTKGEKSEKKEEKV